MIQFYALSIFLNLIGGCALCSTMPLPLSPATEGMKTFFSDRHVRFVLGILMSLTGFFKLFSTIRGDIPGLGDFVPSVTGIVGGLAMLPPSSSSVRFHSGLSASLWTRFRRVVENKEPVLGLAAIIGALVHFMFPTILFL